MSTRNSSSKYSRYKHAMSLLVLLELMRTTTAVILTPPYFNLVANKKVEATATCGEGINEPEFYCKLTGSTATDKETSNYANLVQVIRFFFDNIACYLPIDTRPRFRLWDLLENYMNQ